MCLHETMGTDLKIPCTLSISPSPTSQIQKHNWHKHIQGCISYTYTQLHKTPICFLYIAFMLNQAYIHVYRNQHEKHQYLIDMHCNNGGRILHFFWMIHNFPLQNNLKLSVYSSDISNIKLVKHLTHRRDLEYAECIPPTPEELESTPQNSVVAMTPN